MADPAPENTGQTAIPDFIIDTLARCLLPALRSFYDSPEGKAEFDRWKAEHKESDT